MKLTVIIISIMTVNLTTFSLTTLSIRYQKCDTQLTVYKTFSWDYAECHYAECSGVLDRSPQLQVRCFNG